jgi:hypothetical protein
MFDWITKIFNSKPNETVELSDEEKKRSSDDFVTPALIFPSTKHELNPNGSSDSSDAGCSDGGGGGDGGG